MAAEDNQFSVLQQNFFKVTFKVSTTLNTSILSLLTCQQSWGCFSLWCVQYILFKWQAKNTMPNLGDSAAPMQLQGLSNYATHNPRKELLDYLKSKLASTKNPVEWWGVHTSMLSHLFLLSDILQKNAKDFPTIAHITHDYLAIQGSSVASE